MDRRGVVGRRAARAGGAAAGAGQGCMGDGSGIAAYLYAGTLRGLRKREYGSMRGCQRYPPHLDE